MGSPQAACEGQNSDMAEGCGRSVQKQSSFQQTPIKNLFNNLPAENKNLISTASSDSSSSSQKGSQ